MIVKKILMVSLLAVVSLSACENKAEKRAKLEAQFRVAKEKARKCISPFISDAAMAGFEARMNGGDAKKAEQKMMADAESKCKNLVDDANAIQAELDKLNGVKR